MQAYWVEQPGRGALRDELFPEPTQPGHSVVHTLFTGISAGTERLVGMGEVPPECWEIMACPHMAGSFAMPVKYGYCLVGEAISGPQAGRVVYAMHPHQSKVALPNESLLPIPTWCPPLRGVLIPNLETALNAVWDAEYRPGEPVAVIGGGMVGLLVTFVLQSVYDADPWLFEADAGRRGAIEALGWVPRLSAPSEIPRGEFAVCFHATGLGEGLQLAIDSVEFEGRVIELSWFGTRAVTLSLGGSFHYDRKRLIASQVSTIARVQRHMSHRERLEHVLSILEDAALDRIISPVVPFADLPAFMSRLCRGNTGGLQHAVSYR